MISTNDKAEVMYAMDIIASKLDGGNRIADWEGETGLSGPAEYNSPSPSQTALYEGWLKGKGKYAEDEFRNLVSSFVFLLCREAFGRIEALDCLECNEEVF